ncbi:hypothetical protein Tco_1010734, partial [Tanacetum coccineum]
MDFRSFMIQGVDGEFNFLPDGGFNDNQASFSAKSVNNKIHIIDAKPISFVLPANVVDISLIPITLLMMMSYLQCIPPHLLSLRWGSKGSYSGKVAGNASTPLDVDNDPDIHEFPSTGELKDATNWHWVVAHGQVNGLHNEYGMLLLKERKLANYEQTLSILYAKVKGLESERERLKAFEIQVLQEIDSLRQDKAA